MSVGRTVGLTVALLAMLAAGLWIGGHPAHMPPVLRDVFVDESAGLTAEASELIEDDYYRSVPQGELVDSSLQGMVRGLRRHYRDRFSEYFSPAALARFNEAIEGRFSGVGLSVTQVEDGLGVQAVFKRSPAERAGIEVGDTIVSVDGRAIAGLSAAAAASRIKGPEGTEVTVGVRDGAKGKPRLVKLTREQISVPVVASRLKTVGERKLGDLRIASFTEGVHAPVAAQLRRLQKRGAQGLVLDLRGNGGGLLEEAVLTASVFLPEGETVVSTRSRSQGNAVYETRGGNLPALPIAVLIDRNTASAAEILAAALADDAGARTVGTRSYGKGVFQQEVGLSNGGALKLTVGEYFTPDGVNLAGKGIRPDVRAPDQPRTARDEGLERALGLLAGE
ncbi:MAG TPA: S41 family peptidase [Solirubrobacterales bacterium]|jgi:carboxyl-terminal processing protease|nr:S41 family peptidase [Solirubrobacterales bacterium]